MSTRNTKEHRQPTAHRAVRQPPSAERQRLIDEHLARVKEIGALIDKQWADTSVSAADAIAEQRR